MHLDEMRKKSNIVNSSKWQSYWDDVLEKGVKKCSCCSLEKNLSEFSIKKNGKYLSQCKECEKLRGLKKLVKKTSNIEGKLTTLLYGVTRRCRVKKLDCDIDLNFLLSLYNKQNGKCFYTNHDMIIIGNGLNKKIDKSDYFYKVSIDRINSNLGYTRDNVVLCCIGINVMKQDLPLEIFLNFCKKIINNEINIK